MLAHLAAGGSGFISLESSRRRKRRWDWEASEGASEGERGLVVSAVSSVGPKPPVQLPIMPLTLEVSLLWRMKP